MSISRACSRRTGANDNLRIATHVFDYIIGQYEGELFLLSNNDFVFIAEGVPRMQIDRSLERLRALFSEDPLVYAIENSDSFCTWYELETDYDFFLAHAKSMMNRFATDESAPPEELIHLDAKSLSSLEENSEQGRHHEFCPQPSRMRL